MFENGSSINVGTSARGSTTQFLHVSEMGKIARKYPEKAAEIVSGAFESVPLGGLRLLGVAAILAAILAGGKAECGRS